MSPAATSLNRGFVFLTGHKDSFVLFDSDQLQPSSGRAGLLVFMRIHECQWSLPDAIIKIFVRTFIISCLAATVPIPAPPLVWPGHNVTLWYSLISTPRLNPGVATALIFPARRSLGRSRSVSLMSDSAVKNVLLLNMKCRQACPKLVTWS